jgi:hypothetical protein
VAAVEEPKLRLLRESASVFELAASAMRAGRMLRETVERHLSAEQLDYDPIYDGRSDWRLLTPVDHPEPSRCFVTGTGLTHRPSADNRQSMHVAAPAGPPPAAGVDNGVLTDSMKMYQIGLAGGRPEPGAIGAAPEWFYKGVGTILRGHNEPLCVPAHGDDGGEEAEIAGVYVIADDGVPHRIGLVQGNEFSDHVMEAKNYLYLAASKLRDCAVGPELAVDADFDDVPGHATIERGGRVIWQAPQASGERWMCHSLANLEHHHFKHNAHRRPGDVHVHFLGAGAFSYRDRLRLEDGDVMTIAFEGFGRALRNPVRVAPRQQALVDVKAL